VGGPDDHEVDNSCNSRIGLTFDDGPSYYRSQTLANLRAEQVHATFFDLGVRLAARTARSTRRPARPRSTRRR
jgi:peptidoglycan/xylan/chitin deacetylase (PgdA/CDA1 family)